MTFLEYNTAFRSGFHMPIKNSQRPGSGRELPPPDAFSGTRLPYKEVVHWLRVHLGGRRHVDMDLLKLHVQGLTERQWVAAVREAPSRHQLRNSLGNSLQPRDQLEKLADTHVNPSEAVYFQELLSILENNLMSEEMPYFRAIVERTPAKELAETLGANPNTAWRRMKTVRMKVQDIIRALGGHISS